MNRLRVIIILLLVLVTLFIIFKPRSPEFIPGADVEEQELTPQPPPAVTPDAPTPAPGQVNDNASSETFDQQPVESPPAPTESARDESHGLFAAFEDQPVDPRWSERKEIELENFLFSSKSYTELDIESITCKASLCEIRLSERADTVWAKVVHDLTEEQGWELSAWRYADYHDADGKRIIRTVLGEAPNDEN